MKKKIKWIVSVLATLGCMSCVAGALAGCRPSSSSDSQQSSPDVPSSEQPSQSETDVVPSIRLDYQEIINEWSTDSGVNVHLTIDREQEGWDGHVGFVPTYVKELGFEPNKTAVLCGPPIMIKFTLQGLSELGFDKKQVFTTLELRMKCGIGKCGRCNVGSKYVCKDGPVFRMDQLDALPDEY